MYIYVYDCIHMSIRVCVCVWEREWLTLLFKKTFYGHVRELFNKYGEILTKKLVIENILLLHILPGNW